MNFYNGMEVMLSPGMTERVRYSRSPARADRREKKGYRQHYITRPRTEVLISKIHNKIVMHPAIWEQLKKQIPIAPPDPVFKSALIYPTFSTGERGIVRYAGIA